MNLLTAQENVLLNAIIRQCYGDIITVDRCNEILDQFKQLVPFDDWGLVNAYFDGERIHLDELAWFANIPGFEEYYLGNQLFLIDPIAQECLQMVKQGKLKVIFWQDVYQKHPHAAFFEKIKDFPILNYHGYTVQHKINLLQSISFSITGAQIKGEKDRRIVQLLELMAPHMAAIVQNGKLGRLTSLTDKQFLLYQLLKTSLSYKQIAKIMNITPSGVEKTFTAIKRKIGVNNKKELSFGFDNP